jgi:transcriptional regulator with XRE-family HTH domain
MKIDRSELRKRAGMSLQELSNATGISVSRLSNFERGQVRLSDDALATIAAVLKDRLDTTPQFSTSEEVSRYLTKKRIGA